MADTMTTVMGMVRRLRPERRAVVVVALVAVAALVVYANSLANGFAYDDEAIVRYREVVHGLGNFREILRAEYWPTMYRSGLYRPLTLLSFALDWSLWSGAPFGFHLTNVLLHALVSALVAFTLLRFFPWWAAMAGGLVFAVHPVHTEAVANVVGRAELLVALFVLIACVIYTKSARADRFSIGSIVAIAALYGAACFSKEGGVVMPGLLLASDLPLARGRSRSALAQMARMRLPLYASLTVVLALVLTARQFVLGTAIGSVPDRVFTLDGSFSARVLTMARVWPRYFELLLLPTELSADYSPAIILPVDRLTIQGAFGMLLVAAVAVLAVASFRRAPELTAAVCWVGIAILPVSNLIVTAEIVLAERTLYLPSVGVAIVAAAALAVASGAWRPWIAFGLAAWLLGFSAVTVLRNPVWYSTNTVFDAIRRKHPESSKMLWILGHQFRREGDWEEAKRWFDRSLEIWPYHATYLADYAVMLSAQGELERAAQLASRAVELEGDYRHFHRLLAVTLLRKGEPDEAVAAIERGLQAVGPDRVLYLLQSDAYARMGRLELAVPALERAIRTDSRRRWSAWFRLASLRVAAGDTAGGLAALDSARLAPDAEVAAADSAERVWAGERGRVDPSPER